MSRTVLLWVLVVALAATLTGLAGQRALAARRGLDQSHAKLVSLQKDITELLTLRQSTPGGGETTTGSGDLGTRVGEALAASGLPSSVLVSLPSPTGGVVAFAGDMAIVNRSCTMTLQGLTLPEAGGLLDAWRRREPAWTITRIDLTPVQTRETPVAGGDLPLRALITIESITHTARSPGERR